MSAAAMIKPLHNEFQPILLYKQVMFIKFFDLCLVY